MSAKHIQEILASQAMFESLTRDERKMIVETGSLITYEKGETISKQGALCAHANFIANGLCKMYLEGPYQRKLIIALINKRTFIGLSKLYDSDRNLFSVTALDDCDVLEIPKTTIRHLVEKNKEFAKRMIADISRESNDFLAKLYSQNCKQLHGRLSGALLYMRHEISQNQFIDLPVSRRDLADMSGIATESAIRMLSELSHDGIISLEGKAIRIVREDLLQKLYEIG